ncbi:hypothetical protein KCU83_g221, partial [Aureobasidium melanogenum]
LPASADPSSVPAVLEGAISKGVYQGKLSDGEPFTITKADISAEPKTFQLRKEPGHHNCYRLVCRTVERYRELRAIGAACGPKQRDMPNRAKTVYHFCNGERVTDLELKQDEDIANYDIVAIKDSDDLWPSLALMRDSRGIMNRTNSRKKTILFVTLVRQLPPGAFVRYGGAPDTCS